MMKEKNTMKIFFYLIESGSFRGSDPNTVFLGGWIRMVIYPDPPGDPQGSTIFNRKLVWT